MKVQIFLFRSHSRTGWLVLFEFTNSLFPVVNFIWTASYLRNMRGWVWLTRVNSNSFLIVLGLSAKPLSQSSHACRHASLSQKYGQRKVWSMVAPWTDYLKVQSAFMIDLNQVSLSLRNCTNRSLILLDEFGKGTLSTGEHEHWVSSVS